MLEQRDEGILPWHPAPVLQDGDEGAGLEVTILFVASGDGGSHTTQTQHLQHVRLLISPLCCEGTAKRETTVVVTSIPVSPAGLHDRWDEGTGQNHTLSITEKKGTRRQRSRIPNSLKVLTMPMP